MVPEIAILPENDQMYVFTISPENVVKRLKVVIGRRRAGAVEVLEGLQEGDIVVKEGIQDLRDGAKVKVVNADEISRGPGQSSDAARHPG